MGCGGSTYTIKVSEFAHIEPNSWIAEPSCKLVPLKNDCFRPSKPLGKGKFGIVFLSKHQQCNKYVAIKFIPLKIVYECDCQARLQHEIDILQKIDHPFIAHCFGGYSTPGSIALVFEYAYGGELYTRMKQFNSMPLIHAKFYFAEIACALDYLHNTLNIVYRDLKPENILIDMYGHIKLCDFGFAMPLGYGDNYEGLKDTVGTAMYVAPEIARGKRGETHSQPVDWWSLGCVLYEMVVGSAPFGDTDKMSKFEIFNNVINNSVRLPTSIMLNTPLANLINGLLEKDPSKRGDWEVVKKSSWLSEIDWTAIKNLKVVPPWKPTLSDEPSANNFVDWTKADMSIPTSATTEISSYCSQITLPRIRYKEDPRILLSGSKVSPTRSNSCRSLRRQGSATGERKTSGSSTRKSSKIDLDGNDSTPMSSPKHRTSKSLAKG